MSEKKAFSIGSFLDDDLPGISIKTLIAFIVISGFITIAGYQYYLSEKNGVSIDKWKELSAIVGLKEREIASWRKERLSDANFIFNNEFIANKAFLSMHSPHLPSDDHSNADWMQSMFKNKNYESIVLFDRSHVQRVAVPETVITVTPVLDSLLEQSVREERIIFSDFYRDATHRPMLSVVIPLIVHAGAGSGCSGIIVLEINPMTSFFPLVQSWPIPSTSGEFAIVRQDGDSIIYLNTLRFRDNVSSWISVPLSDASSLGPQAFRSRDTLLQANDYRGEDTFGVARPVEGTEWRLIAKYDAREVYAPLLQTRLLLLMIVFMIVVTGGISILFVLRHRRGLYYRREYERELERRLSAAALRESEERFRMLVASLNEIVYTLDTSHRFIGVYGSWVERFGLDAGAVRGMFPEEIFGIDEHVNHRMMENRALQGEHVLYESIYTETSTGEVRDVQTSLSPLRSSSGEIIGIVGVGRDITKIKHLERDLIQSQKMDSLGKLAGGIAHDFNNLLAMLMGSAELLKRNLKDDVLNLPHVKRILEATDRGASIAKRLLLFSRQGAAEFQPISLSHILTEVCEMLRYSLPKTIDVVLDIQVDNAMVNGDAGHLHQAFVNLCINANDAMGDQGTLTLTERMVDSRELAGKYQDIPQGTYIAVSISDTGTGIDQALVGKIFEPFFTTKEKGKGTGLGLSIVDGIIRNHHGYLDVESEQDKGTTFTLYFPMYMGPIVETQHQEDEHMGRGETILVVDDEKLIRELLGEYLVDFGYRVLLAGDAQEALAMYKEKAGSIDIVITDLGMPKMSGEELFTKLRELDPTASVIISSGYLDGTTRTSLLSRGILGVLTKPYRLNEIQKMLAERRKS
jgi:PAS domain S-box-containing protein